MATENCQTCPLLKQSLHQKEVQVQRLKDEVFWEKNEKQRQHDWRSETEHAIDSLTDANTKLVGHIQTLDPNFEEAGVDRTTVETDVAKSVDSRSALLVKKEEWHQETDEVIEGLRTQVRELQVSDMRKDQAIVELKAANVENKDVIAKLKVVDVENKDLIMKLKEEVTRLKANPEMQHGNTSHEHSGNTAKSTNSPVKHSGIGLDAVPESPYNTTAVDFAKGTGFTPNNSKVPITASGTSMPIAEPHARKRTLLSSTSITQDGLQSTPKKPKISGKLCHAHLVSGKGEGEDCGKKCCKFEHLQGTEFLEAQDKLRKANLAKLVNKRDSDL